MNLIPASPGFHPIYHQQYIIPPLSISPGDIQKIAEAVRDAMKDSLREEFARIVDEKIAPLHATIDQLRTDNKDLRSQLDELEQYGRRPLIRFSGIRETTVEDTSAVILQMTKTVEIALDPQDIVNSHRVVKPANRRQGPPRS